MIKAGILGGGQLGRMLLQSAADFVVETYVLENDVHCPAAHLCHHFVKGDIMSFDDVYNFGKGLNMLTIEIEAVNIDALEKLEAEGVKVFPKPAVIKTIKNKITQKQFYTSHGIATPGFIVTQNKDDVKANLAFLPAVHKIGEGGYDGKGVQVLQTSAFADKAFDAPAVLEKKVAIKKELAVIVATNGKGSTAIYPPAEMVFDAALNLLDYQISPARITKEMAVKAEAIALKVVQALQSAGIFAVELFVDADDNVLVNETAPRVHNSGHHTIEANYCSQFNMLWRVLLGLPLGNTNAIQHSCIVNVIGEKNYSGAAVYKGLEDVLKLDNVFVHLYGKAITKPGRKMGHVTVMSNETSELIYKVEKIKRLLKVVSE